MPCAGEVRDAPGDGAGLAGAGAREHADRTAWGGDRRTLLVVQPCQRVLGGTHAPILTPRTDSPERLSTGKNSACQDVESCMSQLTMYSTTWCGYCRRLKIQLDAAGVLFDEVNIERDPEAAAFVEGVNGGNRTVPTVRFDDGSALTNPSLTQVMAKLDTLAA
jgi:mycoredoxin